MLDNMFVASTDAMVWRGALSLGKNTHCTNQNFVLSCLQFNLWRHNVRLPNPPCSRNVVVVKVGVKSDIFCWIYGSDPGKRERKGLNNTTILFCQHSWRNCDLKIRGIHGFTHAFSFNIWDGMTPHWQFTILIADSPHLRITNLWQVLTT